VTERAGVLVLGGSVAAAGLVTQLREDGYDGRLLVIDRDPDMPYDRPPLSKEFLAGPDERPPAPWWTGGCDNVVGDVQALHAGARVASIRRANGSLLEVVADHVVIATGSEPVRLPGQPDGVASLRTAQDARALRGFTGAGRRAVVLGAGTVGTEVASSLVASGAEVTLVDLADRPLDRFLAGHLADETAAWIRSAGVRLELETRVLQISSRNGTWWVDTDRGTFDADVVVSAVGTRPAVSWLEGSGIAVNDGVLCDKDGQVLSTHGAVIERVHAIGDAASWMQANGSRRRREDWTSAQRQGRHVARCILGLAQLDDLAQERDYFWSNQFGRRIQVLGTPTRSGALVVHVDEPDRNAAFYTVEEAGVPVAWISVNRPREFAMAMRQSATAVS
jgi:3-phenylpropionate/trans-cinnamate dioxygenase ferredoxin reductase subunit